MTPAQIDLLSEVADPNKRIRPLADSRLAFELQVGGMATVEYLDDGARVKITPTKVGERWLLLRNRPPPSKEKPHRRRMTA